MYFFLWGIVYKIDPNYMKKVNNSSIVNVILSLTFNIH